MSSESPNACLALFILNRVSEEILYIRYQNVVPGVANFTAFLPSELDDIEKVVRQGGGIVGQFRPKAAPRF